MTGRGDPFGPFYRALAEIAREKARDERARDRLVLEVAEEIARQPPPPVPLRPGVEIVRGMAYIEEGGIQ